MKAALLITGIAAIFVLAALAWMMNSQEKQASVRMQNLYGTEQPPAPVMKPQSEYERALLHVGSTTVTVEIADTMTKRTRGLSGRMSLGKNEGMLFVYNEPGIYVFWMPDMYIALDIIWFDERYTVVGIERNATPESYPVQFSAGVPSNYVLEVPSGFVDEHGITLGSQARLVRDTVKNQ